MEDSCGTRETVPPGNNLVAEAIALLQNVPNFQLSTDPHIVNPPEDQFSLWETSTITAFETIVHRSAPFLVNADTASILIATFTLLMANSLIFRQLIASAREVGRFSDIRFENRYQVDNVPQNQARGLNDFNLQRDYIRLLSPQRVFLDPTVLQAATDTNIIDEVEQYTTLLSLDVSINRYEDGLNFINLPMMANQIPWDIYEQFIDIFAHEVALVLLMVQPIGGVAEAISRAIMFEFMGSAMSMYENFRVFASPIQFNFLLPVMLYQSAADFIQRIGDLAYRVDFDEPFGRNERVGGEVRYTNYARLSMDQLEGGSLISNPRSLMPWTMEEMRISRSNFSCRLQSSFVLGRYRQILNREDVLERSKRISRQTLENYDEILYSGECPLDAEPIRQPKCVDHNANLNIVERQFIRTAERGEFQRKNFPSWLEFFNSQSWSDIRIEGGKMAGRVWKAFLTRTFENYGYIFNDGSFVVGITSLSIKNSDTDNWIFENGNTYANWNDRYNGQILFDRNGRPVAIIMGLNRFFPVLRSTWVYEFTKDNDWKWTSSEWQPPANKLSKNKGLWFFSLKKRRMTTERDTLWTLKDLNLASTRGIVDMHCNDSIMNYHDNWTSFYDDMHLSRFDTLQRKLFRDGSYMIGITNPERSKKDNIARLITKSWTVPKVYRYEEKDDFRRGPYFGVLVFDRQKRPVLAAFRENTNYISLHYYIDADWKWANNMNWKQLFRDSLSHDPKAPRFTLPSCKKVVNNW